MKKVLDFTKSYTFCNYFDMGIEADVLAWEFGYGFDRRSLALPQLAGPIEWLANLELRVSRILSHVRTKPSRGADCPNACRYCDVQRCAVANGIYG